MTAAQRHHAAMRSLKRAIADLERHRRALVDADLWHSVDFLDARISKLWDQYYNHALQLEALGERGWRASIGSIVRQLRETLTRISTHESPDSRRTNSTR